MLAIDGKEAMMGFDVSTLSAERCVEDIGQWIGDGGACRWLACLNPHSYVTAMNRPDFKAALHDADWLTADGVGVVIASAILGGHIRRRVTGFDIFEGVNRCLNGRGGSAFLLGSTEQTLTAVRARLNAQYPQLRVLGSYSPPFKEQYSDADVDAMVAAINDTSPDVLWVAMTAPKQELWLQRVRARINVKFAGAVGAVFDFYAGNVKRSSPAFQRCGLEWLPRLVQEPRRLWRRTLVSGPVFLCHVARAYVRKGGE